MMPGQLVDVVAVDHVVGRERLGAVHAHVERSVVAVAEPAVGAIELRRRHAEVEQRPGQLVDPVLPEHLGQAVEAAVHGGDPIAEAGEAAAGGGEGVGILVEAEDVIDP